MQFSVEYRSPGSSQWILWRFYRSGYCTRRIFRALREDRREYGSDGFKFRIVRIT